MQLDELKPQFDKLQKKFGDKNLNAIYGAGFIKKPDIFFVFMNPTGRNISSAKKWQGLRAPWLGTKNVWKLFFQIGLLEKNLFADIAGLKSSDWNYEFCDRVYSEVYRRKYYITNLSKSTKSDARGLPDSVFREYLPLLKKEIDFIKPRKIIAFGNQVSSILLEKPIKVSACRKKVFDIKIKTAKYLVYPTYYPVGQGMRNLPEAVKDIKWIIKQK